MAARPRNDSPTRWVTREGDSWIGKWEVYKYDAAGEPVMKANGYQAKQQFRHKIGAAIGPKRLTAADAYRKLCEYLNVEMDPERIALDGNMTDIWDRYSVKYYRTSSGQKSTMKGIWGNHIKPTFGRYRPAEVKPHDIEIFLDGMAAKFRPSTCDKARVLLAALFRYAVDERMIRSTPMNRVQFRLKTGPSLGALTAADIRAIRGKLKGEDLLKFDVLWQTGITRSEARALRRNDITPEGLVIDEGYDEGALTDLKTDRRRAVIALPADLAGQLARYAENSTKWLWPAKHGKGPWDAAAWVTDVLRPAAKEAGVKSKINLQMIRRTTSTLLRQAGATAVAVAGILRNSAEIVERHYTDTAQLEAQRAAMEKMTAGVMEKGRLM